MMKENKIFKHIDKIKTPISLAGLSLMILYLILSSILKLDIFEKVNSNQTYNLIDKIISYVFYIAILTIILGVTSYLISILRKKKAKLELIDVSIDKSISDKVNKTVLGDFTFDKVKYDNGKLSEAVDFKFLNTGEGTAFLTNVEIEIIESSLDETPILHFRYSLEKDNLTIKVNNKGWGDATIKNVNLKNDVLNQFVQTIDLNPVRVMANSEKTILQVSKELVSKGLKHTYKENLLKRKKIIQTVYEYMLSKIVRY